MPILSFGGWSTSDPWVFGFLVLSYLIAVAVVPRILLERRESTATLSWLLVIIFLPYLGLILFWLMGTRRLHRVRVRKARADWLLSNAIGATRAHAVREFGADEAASRDAPVLRDAMRLADRLTQSTALAGNRVELLLDGEATFDAIEHAVADATDHVHLLYYIFQPDRTGTRFRDLLVEKARAGVEVRLLYDHVGSFAISRKFIEPLTAAGGKVGVFLPVFRLFRRINVTLRNHRKIVVVDGRKGFTGGINVGDEYLSGGRRRRRWRDTHAGVVGPAVLRLQEVFAEDWHFSTGEDLVKRRYFPVQQAAGKDLVRVVSSGPDRRFEVLHHILFTAITAAQKQVLVTTPYFVPDRALEVALIAAALRGVDVRLLLPRRSDNRLVDLTAWSFLPDLLRAGVRVFIYGPGMMHAKTAVIDGLWSTVGSANMDIRSFRLNFETNLVIYGESFASVLAQVILADLKQAEEIRGEALRGRPLSRRLLESACRVLAPIL